jgi:hypothetical protein
MRKIAFCISLFILSFTCVNAAEVSLTDINRVVEVQAKTGKSHAVKANAFQPAEYVVKEIVPLKNKQTDEVVAYISILDPVGFIAVSKDDDIAPVIAYSFEHNFNFEENDENILLYMLRQDMKKRLEAIPIIIIRLNCKVPGSGPLLMRAGLRRHGISGNLTIIYVPLTPPPEIDLLLGV